MRPGVMGGQNGPQGPSPCAGRLQFHMHTTKIAQITRKLDIRKSSIRSRAGTGRRCPPGQTETGAPGDLRQGEAC